MSDEINFSELYQTKDKDLQMQAEELRKEIVKDVTKEDSLDPNALRYYLLGIYQELHESLGTRNALIKILSEQSGVPIKDLKIMYADEVRQSRNEAARSNPIPSKYKEVAVRILQMLASPNKEIQNESHELLTKTFMENFNVVTTRNDKRNEIWIYEEGIYVPNGVTYIKEFCRVILGAAYEMRFVEKVLAKIEADSYVDEDVFFNQQNKYPYVIPVKNGLLDIKEGVIGPYDPKRYFFNKINAVYDPTKDCPYIKKFLNDVLGSKEDVEGIREFTGYCLVKHYRYAKSLLLEGDGSNGKTTYIKLMNHFLDEKNVSNINLHSLTNDRFSVQNLHNKLANLVPDIKNTDLEATDIFRALTGNDPVECDRKFKETIKFTNYAKMIFGANSVPMPKDDVDAFFRRWIFVSFPYKFLPAHEFEEFKHRGNIKLRDDHITDKLFTDDEMSGFLNWVIKGYNRVEMQGDFSNTQSLFSVKKRWIRSSNSFAAFVMDNLVDDNEGRILSSDLKQSYTRYCKVNGLSMLGSKKINNYMDKEMGCFSNRVYIGDARPQVWDGVRFKDGVDVEVSPGVVLSKDHFVLSDGSAQTLIKDDSRVDDSSASSDSLVVEEDVVGLVEFVGLRDAGNGVFLEDVLRAGFSEGDVTRLIKEGVLFSPRPGVVKCVE